MAEEMEMKRNMRVLYASASALLFCGVFAGATPVLAAELKCECTDLDKCVLEKGRESVKFNYDTNNMSAYDALEAKAMKDADDEAADNGEAAYDKWSAAELKCPEKCEGPEIWWKHGKPFGGGSEGKGIGRSTWKVSYICKQAPDEDEDEDTDEEDEQSGGPNIDIGIGFGVGVGGGDHHHHHDHDHHGHDHEHGDHGGDHHDGHDKGGKHDHDKGDKEKNQDHKDHKHH
jgi:hypothetical protein